MRALLFEQVTGPHLTCGLPLIVCPGPEGVGGSSSSRTNEISMVFIMPHREKVLRRRCWCDSSFTLSGLWTTEPLRDFLLPLLGGRTFNGARS